MSAIDNHHLEHVCQIRKGPAGCAFLMYTSNGFECSKGTNIEPVIRTRLAAGQMNAKGDNCPGYNIEMKIIDDIIKISHRRDISHDSAPRTQAETESRTGDPD